MPPSTLASLLTEFHYLTLTKAQYFANVYEGNYTQIANMKIESKPPEVIQGQIAAFANDKLAASSHEGDQIGEVYRHVGELAAGPVTDMQYTVNHNRVNYVTLERYNDPRQYTVTGQDYVAHLRRNGGSRNEQVRQRARYLNAYASFAPVIGDKVQELQTAPAVREKDSSFVGRGSNASAYGFEHQGKQYVAKIPHGRDSGAQNSDTRLTELIVGEGLSPHLEQLAALSYEDGVSIMERLPGTDLLNTPIEQADAVTEDQLREAIRTMRIAQDAGIALDPKPSNYLYATNEGFGFIDYRLQEANAPEQTLAAKASYFVTALAHFGTRIPLYKTKEDFLITARENEYRIPLLERYRTVCLEQPDAQNYAPTIAEIDEQISYMRQVIANVRTPGWIEDHFVKEAQRKAEMREQARLAAERAAQGIPDFV
jgi:hypothetical protein